MEYPVVSLQTIQEFLRDVRVEGKYSDAPAHSVRGSGDSFILKYRKDLLEFDQEMKHAIHSAKKRADVDEIEGQLSVKTFSLLYKLPAEVLTDRDFWRYLSCTYFFDFAIWRDGGKDGELPSDASFGASSKTITMDCVPFRMFNRGLIDYQLNQRIDDGSYASIAGTDVWRSHILRVKTSYAPELVRQMLERLKAGQLPTDVVRPLARSIRRLRANIVFENLNFKESNDIIEVELNKITQQKGNNDKKTSKK